jgi:hypothetical protein
LFERIGGQIRHRSRVREAVGGVKRRLSARKTNN